MPTRIKKKVRAKEMSAEVRPSERAVNSAEAKILYPAKRKDSEKSRMPRFTSWAEREPSGVKITAMSPELRKDTTHTTTDAPSTKRMQ